MDKLAFFLLLVLFGIGDFACKERRMMEKVDNLPSGPWNDEDNTPVDGDDH